MARSVRIAVVGLGQIARNRHLPTIAASPAFELAATVSPDGGSVAGVPHFPDWDALLRGGTAIDAVALCTPPKVRFDLARSAVERGLDVLLEKPPASTPEQVETLAALARAKGVTLFTAWHSQFAAGVAGARDWLAGAAIRKVDTVWHEDVRVWHPGQEWIWEAEGLGVFDPGINALSILAAILPGPIRFASGTIEVPANRAAPIAAELRYLTADGAPISISLDWRRSGEPRWDIAVETRDGECLLSRGGTDLTLPRSALPSEDREYPALYARFAELIDRRASDVDCRPLQLVVDALRSATRTTGQPFV